MAKIQPRVLLVEGKQDRFVIPELIEANGVDWGTKNDPVVSIRELGGDSKLVDPNVISTELQASGLSALGIIIDADDTPKARWQSIRNATLKSVSDIPDALPEEGLIHSTSSGVKFGIWIMPDNAIRGMLETFLAYMIPEKNEPLWQFAQESAQEARRRGAPFADAHTDKANIYTWLAWQDPPGRQLHQAIMERILDPKHPRAQKFVTWFKELYSLS